MCCSLIWDSDAGRSSHGAAKQVACPYCAACSKTRALSKVVTHCSPTCCLVLLQHYTCPSAAAACCATAGSGWSRWSRSSCRHTGSTSPATTASSSAVAAAKAAGKAAKHDATVNTGIACASANKRHRPHSLGPQTTPKTSLVLLCQNQNAGMLCGIRTLGDCDSVHLT